MKLLIMLLFSYTASATTYYVSNTGSDLANGTSTGTAWQTISKVNGTTLNPGDQVLFKKGDSWNETLIISYSGSAGNLITYGAYGSGNKPIITGFQNLSASDQGSNIWSGTATNSVAIQHTVLINGQIQAKARIPNTSFLSISGVSGFNQITGSLSGTPNYTGSEIVIRPRNFIIDRLKITSQSGGTINFTPNISYQPSGTSGYFIQNVVSAIDTLNEWAYDSTSKLLTLRATSSPTVKYSSLEKCIYLHNKNYITFDGLKFEGANSIGAHLDTASYITFNNCSINNMGAYGIFGSVSTHVTIDSTEFEDILSTGIFLVSSTANPCDYPSITNNNFNRIGILTGMGGSNVGQNMAMYVVGYSPVITNNRLDSIGYIGINVTGQFGLVEHNYTTNFCFIKDDGAAYYSYIGATWPSNYDSGLVIKNNIAVNGLSAPLGVASPSWAAGVYLDENSKNGTVSNNTFYNCNGAGIVANKNVNTTFRSNTVLDSIGHGMFINSTASGLNIKSNIFHVKHLNLYALYPVVSNFSLGTIDSNYYSKRNDESVLIRMFLTNYSLSGWQTATTYDDNSHGTPSGITAAAGTLYINPTLSDSTINFTGLYLDARGTEHNYSIVLPPFGSALLFKADHERALIRNIGNLIFR